MTLTNTFLATVASFVPLGDGAELPKQPIKTRANLAAAVSRLGDEFSPAIDRDLGEQYAQAPSNINRSNAGGGGFLPPINQNGLPGRRGIQIPFGIGARTYGVPRRVQNQQMNGNAGQQPQANPNQTQPQAQSAIKSHQATKDELQLNFQERVLSQKFASKLKFKDKSIPETIKQETAGILAKTQIAFNKLPKAEQTEAKYGELFNANSKAAGYKNGVSDKAITAYYKLNKEIQEADELARKSIPEPDLDANTDANSVATKFGYSPVTGLPDGKTTKSKDLKADELAYLKKIVGVENISDQNLLEVKNFAIRLSKLQPGEQKRYRDAFVQTRFQALGFKDQEQLRSALDTIANDPAETIKK